MPRKFRRKKNPFNVSLGGVTGVALVAVAGVAVFLLWRWLKRNPGAFNPASTNNLVYRGANKAVAAVTGDNNATVGTKIADWWKSSNEKKVDASLKTKPADGGTFTPAPPDATPVYGIDGSDGMDDVEDVVAENVRPFRRA